jgi:hypothetical protein
MSSKHKQTITSKANAYRIGRHFDGRLPPFWWSAAAISTDPSFWTNSQKMSERNILLFALRT